jgi:phage-related protein
MANGGEVVFDFKGNDKDLQKSSGKVTNTLKNIGKVGITAMATATTAVAGAFVGMVGASVKARADIEQSIGGVETLFKDSADTVIKNAERAYKTAGVSANQYMEQVTSFSASLLQSLGGDTEKAAKVADRAIIDMADNANKMGTSIDLIQNAYQGFAKGNYTMLDNLKLGYGGTKTEMERLVKDAAKMTDVQKELGVTVDASSMSFGNIVNAISVMQEKLGIAGTTAKEATETLSGSVAQLKASWDNFLAGSGDLSQVVESGNIAFQNLMRIINEAIPDIISGLTESMPQLMQLGGEMIKTIGSALIENMPQLITTFSQVLDAMAQGLSAGLPKIIPAAVNIMQTLLTGLLQNLPTILQAGISSIEALLQGLAQMMPKLIPQAVECIITLVEGLLDNIDKLVDAGVELILALALGIIDALPRLIEKSPVIIEKFAAAIIRVLPKIVVAGAKLIGELIVGIIGALFKLTETAPKIISALVNGIKGLMSTVRDTGKNVITGLWQGISGMAGWLADKVRSFARNILNNMKDALGIHSPSTLFRDVVGKNLALGIGVGFEDEMNNVSKMMKGSMLELGDMFDLSPTLNGTATSNSNVTVNVYNNMETDLMGNLVNRIKTYSNGSKNDYNYGMA